MFAINICLLSIRTIEEITWSFAATVDPNPTDPTEGTNRSECFLNPAGCANDSTGSLQLDIPTRDLRE